MVTEKKKEEVKVRNLKNLWIQIWQLGDLFYIVWESWTYEHFSIVYSYVLNGRISLFFVCIYNKVKSNFFGT